MREWLRERGVFALVVLVLAAALVLARLVDGASWVSLAKLVSIAVIVGRTAQGTVESYIAEPSSPTT